VISGSVSGGAGDSRWYVSDMVFTASASGASPGSGVASLNLSLDGGGWAAHTALLTLTQGAHALDLRAADVAGNAGTEGQAVNVDTQLRSWA
jgi:hypothetical protein